MVLPKNYAPKEIFYVSFFLLFFKNRLFVRVRLKQCKQTKSKGEGFRRSLGL